MMGYEKVFKGKRIDVEEVLSGRSISIWELILYSFVIIIIFIILCVLVSWLCIKVRAVCRKLRQRSQDGNVRVVNLHSPKQLPRVKVLPVVHADELARRPPFRLPEKCVVTSAGTAVRGHGRVV